MSPFMQFMPHKPAKFGIKFCMVHDTFTYFEIWASPHVGKKGSWTWRACDLAFDVIVQEYETQYNY